MKIKNQTIDLIALISSLICAIHCASIPILLSFSTLSSLHFLGNHYVEWVFISFGVVFVFISLWPSFKKIHHKIKPLVYAAIGFGFIALGRLDLNELWEVINTVLGAVIVSVAHYLNWRLLSIARNHKH